MRTAMPEALFRRVRVLFCLAALAIPAAACAAETAVDGPNELARVLARTGPGDVIELAPGRYEARGLRATSSGTADAPIVLRARVPGQTVLATTGVTLLKITGAHWVIEGIDFEGGPDSHHALHIAGGADATVVRGNRFRNFHAAIKGNGEGNPRRFPDGVRIERNVFANDAPRATDAPVTPIDVVGGQGWVVAENVIADFAKDGGNRVSYAAFLKGGARNGAFLRNLVVCASRHGGGIRVGLSLGGGGTGGGVEDPRTPCAAGNCPEAVDMTVAGNIVLHCPGEPGLYLNEAEGALVVGNTFLGTAGVDARFPETSARIENNLIGGRIARRDGGQAVARGNVVEGGAAGLGATRVDAWFPGWREGDLTLSAMPPRPPGAPPMPVGARDFCGHPYTDASPPGAIAGTGRCVVAEELSRRHGPFAPGLPIR